jgi:hypothetical protein
MTLMERWGRLSETTRGFLGVVALAALVAAVYGFNEREAIIAYLTPETVGARLRRECTSIVLEAYPELAPVPASPFDQFDSPEQRAERERTAWTLEREVGQCILTRGRAGR